MAESIEPQSTPAPRLFPTFSRLLRRRSERRWRNIIASSALPTEVAALIHRVVKKTRLWRREKRAVAQELIAHFYDGLSSGQPPESLIQRFGNEAAAARLIRRAKKRNRSWLWHAWRYCVYAFCILVGLYALVLIRFAMAYPTVKVDYVAEMSATALAAPLDQRAWPLYRRAIIDLQLVAGQEDAATQAKYGRGETDDDIDFLDLKPTHPQWSVAARYLADHAKGLSELRQATQKPVFGFIYGRGGSQHDPELGWQLDRPPQTPVESTVIGVLLPALNQMRQLARTLKLDLYDAQTHRDGTRAVADLEAMLGIAAHQDSPIIVSRLVGIGIDALAFGQIERILAEDPTLLSDEQLVRLAHRVSRVGGETAASVIDLRGERMMFDDLMQRTYSDDGHGDGILTPAGAKALPELAAMGNRADNRSHAQQAAEFAATGLYSAISSRQDLTNEYDRLMTSMQAQLSKPLREASPETGYERRFAEIKNSTALTVRYLPIAILAPSLNRLQVTAERMLGSRDGVEIGLALELFRRRHGHYPQSLAELAPRLLPTVPVDRISGQPLKYHILDGHPLVYSVGIDGKDDDGRPPLDRDGHPASILAADWPAANPSPFKPIDGDWIVFGEQSLSSTTLPTH